MNDSTPSDVHSAILYITSTVIFIVAGLLRFAVVVDQYIYARCRKRHSRSERDMEFMQRLNFASSSELVAAYLLNVIQSIFNDKFTSDEYPPSIEGANIGLQVVGIFVSITMLGFEGRGYLMEDKFWAITHCPCGQREDEDS